MTPSISTDHALQLINPADNSPIEVSESQEPDRKIDITATNTALTIQLSPEKTLLCVAEANAGARAYPLFATRALIHDLVITILQREAQTRGELLPPTANPHDCRAAQLSLAFRQALTDILSRMLAEAPASYLSVSLALSPIARTYPRKGGCETWPEFYQYPYLVQEVLRYPAAAFACHDALNLAIEIWEYQIHQAQMAETATPFTLFYRQFFPRDQFSPQGFDPPGPH